MERHLSLRGSHYALSKVTDSEQFRDWIKESQSESPERYFEGYRMFVRACYHTFQNQLYNSLNQLRIESSVEFDRAAAELADIDSISASSEAANLIKHIDEIDQKLSAAHDLDYFETVLNILSENVIERFDSVLSEYGEYGKQADPKEIDNYSASFSLATFANDTSRGYPEAFQYSWMSARNSAEDFDQGFEGYKISLCWAYSVLAPSITDPRELQREIAAAKDWSELNSTFRITREVLLDPFESSVNNHRELFNLQISKTPEQISGLLKGAPDPEVDVNKRLDRLFLWDFANRANETLAGSGVAGILIVIYGLQEVKSKFGTNQKIRIRRLVHPDEPGNNYSYAIETSGWSLQGTGTLHGWVVFVRVATDYSGFGGQQHDLIEEYFSKLEKNNDVEIEEFEVDEEEFKQYLDENQYTINEQRKLRKPKYDQRKLTRIIQRGEDERTEFKEELPDGSFSELGKEIVALANRDGGVLLLGVNDDGNIVGIDDPDQLDNRISGVLRNNCKPPISAEIYIESTPKGDILIVDIPKVSKPIALNYTYYIRTGRNKERMLYEEIKQRFE